MTHGRDRDRRLTALSQLVADYEAEHGFITDEEIADQAQQDRDTASQLRPAARRATDQGS